MRGSVTPVLPFLLLAACTTGGEILGRPDATDTHETDHPPLEDADGDTISDEDEGRYVPGHPVDTDSDTIPDYLDPDSDGDSIEDSDEAGDGDLATPPRDTDSDGTPDFRDLDSDDDCVPDHDEARIHGTDPTLWDSDGDGHGDLLDILGDPDDFLVILPYMAMGHEYRDLTFGTNLQKADVYLLVDTTITMQDAIENMATSLESTIVPALRSEIPDLQMGVGHFNDVTRSPYGGTDDQPFWHVLSITDDDLLVESALDYLHGSDFPWGRGGDVSDSQAVALWCTATGSGFTDCSSAVPRQSCPAAPYATGYPCFRPDALPVIVTLSDSPWHSDHLGASPYDCTDLDFHDALAELLSIGARHLGVFVENWSTDGLAAMQEMSLGTGAVDLAGEALVERVDSGEASAGIVDMIATLATATEQDVSAVARDEPDDPPDADYDASLFIKGIRPVWGFPDSPEGFSHMDETTFYDVVPGTQVTFQVDFYNDVFGRPETAQLFQAWIAVLGSGVAILDRRKVTIVALTEECRAL